MRRSKDRPFSGDLGDFLFAADEDAPIDLTTHELGQYELGNGMPVLRSEVEYAVGWG
jgi:hypothetical protein